MMEFRTKVSITKPSFAFSYQDATILMGSCFVESMGSRLEENKFSVDINPFGTLYNPASIAQSIHRLVYPKEFKDTDLIEVEGIYHSFSHHSRFSSIDKEEMLSRINRRLFEAAETLRKASRLIITFGSAFVYRQLHGNREIVANCHKLPEKLFSRELLSVSDIVEDWNKLLLSLWEYNPDMRILFTVSPIRHWKDGAHQNQLSKATLLLAIDVLQKQYPDRIDYFPAYEIMMDELRDYRFYADDMIHPSPLAIQYIWESFSASFFSAETKSILKEWQEIQKALNHKPFQPESNAYRQFISQTLLKAEQLYGKFPYFDISEEIELLRAKRYIK